MVKYRCSIYENRPEVCKEYPNRNHKIIEGCSYKFNRLKSKMEGECGRCGKCCFLVVDIHKLGNKFYKGDPCPYLEEE